jgi:type II secretory pathway pseudopilin PulG
MSVDAPPRPAPAWRRSLGSGSTTPERLFRVAIVLVVGCLATALVSVLAGMQRTASVEEAQTRIAALTADSAELYRSLADADAMATSGYVSGGREPIAVRTRYDDDIARATGRLVDAAGRLPGSSPVATVAAQLPVYTGLVETARTLNREGLPLGQAFLGSASELMRGTILPAAEELRRQQAAELAEAYERGVAIPFAVGALLLATLVAVVDVSLRERRRTHRTVSIGLLTAAVALVAALLWWVAAVGTANSRLATAQRHSDAVTALDGARTAVLEARSAESLTLVARSAGFASDDDFTAGIVAVVGADGASGLLGRADGGAPGSADRVTALRVAVGEWQAAHRQVRELDDGGRYTDAVASVVTSEPGGSGAAFERLDAALGEAIDEERAAFTDATGSAASALTGLVAGPALLALLAAAGVAVGLSRRIGEYR